MSYFPNETRQLRRYKVTLAETWDRLKKHLKLNSFIDVPALQYVATQIGEDGMTLSRLNGHIGRAEQSLIIARSFLEALRVEKRYLEVEGQVFSIFVVVFCSHAYKRNEFLNLFVRAKSISYTAGFRSLII